MDDIQETLLDMVAEKVAAKKLRAGRRRIRSASRLSLIIITITAASFAFSSREDANPAQATKASHGLLTEDRCIDGLIQTYPDGSPICELLLI